MIEDHREQAWEKLRREVAHAQGMQEATQKVLKDTQGELGERLLHLERTVAQSNIMHANETGRVTRALELVAETYENVVKIHDFHLIKVLAISNTVMIVVVGTVSLLILMFKR